MARLFFVIPWLLLSNTNAQMSRGSSGSTTSTACAQDGSDYEYAEAVSGSTRTVTTNWCPNHYFDNGKLNPNYAIAGSGTITMPANPMLENSSSTVDVSGQGGGVGVLFDGAMIYSPFAGTVALTGYSTSATALEGDTFDKCGEHSSSDTSAGYHTHIPPSCLLHQLNESADSHSPQIGWAPDGFPVYGPRGPRDGAKIKLCSEQTNTDSTYCLDECSGLELELPSVDNFKYRYYITGEDFLDGNNAADPTSGSDPINPLPTEEYYPFTPLCYRGCCPNGVTCSGTRATIPTCSNSATSGVTSSYTAEAKYANGLPIYGSDSDTTATIAPTAGTIAPTAGSASNRPYSLQLTIVSLIITSVVFMML